MTKRIPTVSTSNLRADRSSLSLRRRLESINRGRRLGDISNDLAAITMFTEVRDVFCWETTHEIRVGKRQDSTSTILLCPVQ
jgi:hypothetical protein